MSDNELEAIKRAHYLLLTVGKFMAENPLAEEMTTIFDEAVCDGSCLAEDCRHSANELADAFNVAL